MLEPLPDLRQPVAETVCYQDSSTKVQEEGQDDVLHLLFLSLHYHRVQGVNVRKVIPENLKNVLNISYKK